MDTLIWIFGSTLLISLISLVGVITLAFKGKMVEEIILILVSLSAGAMLGGAFFHLIPETIEKTMQTSLLSFVIVGFIMFFALEKILHWRHCHIEKCDIHTFTYLNLVGDGLHNFIDGLLIAGSFIVDLNLGLATTFAIALHEIPQEIGDFGVLIHGGLKKTRALILNFLVAVIAILGGLSGYFISAVASEIMVFLLPIAAGGFIYIASSDLIPEIRKVESSRASFWTFVVFLLGILIMWGAVFIK